MLKPRAAAAIVGVHPDTLKAWRERKAGPPYVRTDTGRILYDEQQLNRWLQERTVSA